MQEDTKIPARSVKKRELRRRLFTASLVLLIGLQVVYSHSRPRKTTPQTAPETRPPVVVPAPPLTPPPTVESEEPVKIASSAPLNVDATSAILIDSATGQVLYERNADEQRPIASTTKIMTALLFCERTTPDVLIAASKNAAETKESSLHLKEGEKVTAHDLLRAILMRSANDACVAAAEHVAKTEEAFVEMMNVRARELGCTHTHFVNSHGLHDEQHYSTARDLALIGRAAMRELRIAEVVATKRCRIERSIDKLDLTMHNHSRFLGKFPGADGIKTGWTIPAGKCYVGSATQNGWRLISVVLNCKMYPEETAKMMEYGFSRFETRTVVTKGQPLGERPVEDGEEKKVVALAAAPLQMVVRKGYEPRYELRPSFSALKAPLNAAAPIGSLQLIVDGQPLGATTLQADHEVKELRGVAALLHGKSGGSFMRYSLFFATGLVCLGYGKRKRKRIASLAKGSRRRRSRFSESFGGDDTGW